MVWHRPLTGEDVATAHRIKDMHAPVRGYCVSVSATHLVSAPVWPCDQALWVRWVLAANERGEVGSAPANVKRTPA